MRVGLIGIGKGLGDNVLALKALFALKQIYECEVIYFGANGIIDLFDGLNFIDKVVNIGGLQGGFLDEKNVEIINQTPCDYLILGVARSKNLKLLERSNFSKIITLANFKTIFSSKFKSVALNFKSNYKSLSKEDLLLKLARNIDQKKFDEKIASLDFNQTRLQTQPFHKELINHFLSQNVPKNHSLILINPFNISNPYNLTLNGYFMLMRELERLENISIIVPTYGEIHNEFIKALNAFETKNTYKFTKLFVFKNDSDLRTLVELVSRAKILIAPSTGTIHIGSNLDIFTLGIYSKYDQRRWATKDKRYVTIKSHEKDISEDEEKELVEQILKQTQEFL